MWLITFRYIAPLPFEIFPMWVSVCVRPVYIAKKSLRCVRFALGRMHGNLFWRLDTENEFVTFCCCCLLLVVIGMMARAVGFERKWESTWKWCLSIMLCALFDIKTLPTMCRIFPQRLKKIVRQRVRESKNEGEENVRERAKWTMFGLAGDVSEINVYMSNNVQSLNTSLLKRA